MRITYNSIYSPNMLKIPEFSFFPLPLGSNEVSNIVVLLPDVLEFVQDLSKNSVVFFVLRGASDFR